MRTALLCAYSAERLFLFVVPKRLRAFRNYFFTGGNSLSQSLTALPAPSGREPLAKPETLCFNWELYRNAKGPILEGAVERMRDWGSSLVYSTSSSSLR